MKNVLVLGQGYISSKIQKYWSIDYGLVRVSRSDDGNYINRDVFKKLIDQWKPEYVINTYGFTGRPNVDSCEDNKDECIQRNVIDTNAIVNNCRDFGVNLINVSTGCVYNDDRGRVFSEDDPHNFGYKNPTSSVYSYSKSTFELQNFNDIVGYDNFYNLRIRMPFDDKMDDKNYINKIIKYDKLVNYPNSVTYMYDLVKFIEIIVSNDVEKGIYNVVNKNPITAEEVIEIYNRYTHDKKEIDRWYSVDDLLSAGLMKCRRSNCVLSTEKVEKYYPELLTSRDAVQDAIYCWLNNERRK